MNYYNLIRMSLQLLLLALPGKFLPVTQLLKTLGSGAGKSDHYHNQNLFLGEEESLTFSKRRSFVSLFF